MAADNGLNSTLVADKWGWQFCDLFLAREFFFKAEVLCSFGSCCIFNVGGWNWSRICANKHFGIALKKLNSCTGNWSCISSPGELCPLNVLQKVSSAACPRHLQEELPGPQAVTSAQIWAVRVMFSSLLKLQVSELGSTLSFQFFPLTRKAKNKFQKASWETV